MQAWKRSYSSSVFELDNIKTQQFCELRQFSKLATSKTKQFWETSFNFRSWQHQKRSNSARFPSIFEVDNIKNEAILRDFLQFSKLTTSKTKQFCETSFKNGKLSAELTASSQFVLRFLHSTCLNYCACHEKVMPGHTKCCACHAKSSSQNWRSDAPKCNSSQEISARAS